MKQHTSGRGLRLSDRAEGRSCTESVQTTAEIKMKSYLLRESREEETHV